MKLDAPVNSNYAATVVRLPKLLELSGCDNLLGAPLYGFQAIVSKDHEQGDLGIVFGAETQLSADYCHENNLFRHGDLNSDETQKGYLEDNRRIKALKLRGHRSDCLFMPLESLTFTKVDISELSEGDTFDTLNGVVVCQKFVVKTKASSNKAPQVKKFVRVDPKTFPEHISTDNYWKNKHLISDDSHVYVTQKIHGTSWRGAHVEVLRKLSLRDRIAKRFGVKVSDKEWDTVAGSRKVIKDVHNPEQNHFYGSDIWTGYLERVEHLIPEGYVVYGEIVGYTPEGSAIQSNYTYDMAPGVCELYVYRVALVNTRGVMVDLSWPQVRQFCDERELKHVPDLWEGKHSEFIPEEWIDQRFADLRYPQALALGGNQKLVDEGVVVRADGLRPTVLKAKSPIFLAHETKLLDKGEVNLEDEGSIS